MKHITIKMLADEKAAPKSWILLKPQTVYFLGKENIKTTEKLASGLKIHNYGLKIQIIHQIRTTNDRTSVHQCH